MREIAEFVRTSARALVERPQAVRLREHELAGETIFELSCADADRGRLIGRQGATAQALRVLLAAVARRRGVRCRLEITE
jgi:predicted RNA-binding protein YlqC (UPF0109 family)